MANSLEDNDNLGGLESEDFNLNTEDNNIQPKKKQQEFEDDFGQLEDLEKDNFGELKNDEDPFNTNENKNDLEEENFWDNNKNEDQFDTVE